MRSGHGETARDLVGQRKEHSQYDERSKTRQVCVNQSKCKRTEDGRKVALRVTLDSGIHHPAEENLFRDRSNENS